MKYYLILLITFFSINVSANEQALKNIIEKQYPEIKVQSIKRTNFNDLYEVYLGGQIIYTDKDFKFLIVDGRLVDPKTKVDMTAESLAEFEKIPFDDLPLDLAIKIKKGNGKNRVAIFSDLDCPYCRKLEKEVLAKIEDVEIYTFIFPLAIHPEAEEKSMKIWCSNDPSANWIKFMVEAELPKNNGDCKSPVPKIQKFAKEMGIQSTPTIIFENGKRISGAIPLKDFISLM
jgi:thiol:disulfide interchange protein DsbC